MNHRVLEIPPPRDPSDYQVIIPAAGCSRRMAHLTTDQPKSLLAIEGRAIIEHSLDTLDAKGFRHVTLVVGYKRELLIAALGSRYRRLDVDYVISEDYAITEHGWSLYLTRDGWHRSRRPVLFMDADNLYDPAMLDALMASPHQDLMLVDDTFAGEQREEELVSGRNGLVTGLVRGRGSEVTDLAGGFVGINRFSAPFMERLYAFMDEFFAAHGRRWKYERVFDALIRDRGVRIHYLPTEGLAWININHEEEYAAARSIARAMVAAVRAASGKSIG